jgi:Sulfotransferase domain
MHPPGRGLESVWRVAPSLFRTGPPDFVGVGTQRSGTTWWFETLLAHPQIRGPKSGLKEQHFFDRFCGRALTARDIARYHARFPRRPGEIAGEWTPRYMHDFWTPPLIARAAPDARLLIMLRDPIERFRSGVPHRLSRSADEHMVEVIGDAIERGRYASQLRRVLAWHDRSRVLILQYERCRAQPAAEYRRTLAFLGVDADHRSEVLQQQRGTTQQAVKTPLWDDLLDGLRATFEPEVAALARLAPEIDLALWPNFAHLERADAIAA